MLPMILALAVLAGAAGQSGTETLSRSMSAGETCRRGCDPEHGCWVLLVTVLEDDAADFQPPNLTRRFYYIGEPYFSRAAGICGAQRLRREGVCVAPYPGQPQGMKNVAVETVTVIFSDGSEPSYPGFDDCFPIPGLSDR